MNQLITGMILCSVLACKTPAAQDITPRSANTTSMSNYLALGDSYTIGEAVAQQGTFPFQLADSLRARGKEYTPMVIAKTGWTTDELNAAIDAAAPRSDYELVSLLIGVNNQYRGYSLEAYRTEFSALLKRAIGFAGGKKERVFVVSIPDWGVTPFAASSGRNVAQIAKEIDDFNRVNKEESVKLGVKYIDITPVSRKAKNDPTLNASDGLHPSAQMYTLWVKEIVKEL